MKSESDILLPDGSGFAMIDLPLPKDHWIYGEPSAQHSHGYEIPPMPMRMGTDDPRRKEFEDALRLAGKYAVRAATIQGEEMDFDPDAMIQNLIVGMLGYHTPNGLSSSDEWANPKEH